MGGSKSVWQNSRRLILQSRVEIASVPDQIPRGYEKIKRNSIATVKVRASEKLAVMDAVPVPVLK